jgi:hypothetical protein
MAGQLAIRIINSLKSPQITHLELLHHSAADIRVVMKYFKEDNCFVIVLIGHRKKEYAFHKNPCIDQPQIQAYQRGPGCKSSRREASSTNSVSRVRW